MFCRNSLIMAAFVLVASSTVRGQGQWNAASRQEIEKAFDSYGQAFITKDYDKLRGLLQVPFIQWNDGETVLFKNLEEVINRFRSIREALDGRGYQTTQAALKSARLSVLSPTRALLNVRYRRYKTDGSLLEEGAGIYLMSKGSGTWKIQGTMSQDPAQEGKVH